MKGNITLNDYQNIFFKSVNCPAKMKKVIHLTTIKTIFNPT
jgi:hypothetical protein